MPFVLFEALRQTLYSRVDAAMRHVPGQILATEFAKATEKAVQIAPNSVPSVSSVAEIEFDFKKKCRSVVSYIERLW